ncbi:NAD(P)/FAD-dependent oxidoreductase [Aspergillus mulundensis]|uniref:FAD dependent oxidoreductase domain-containing protein n=1 Tax=Aspergillus mulundensis TaxID=1810919 RepID=A0A3D8SX53_9EURO|nr:Uncharacterized protein DSM5745_02516 [Aspergillus mulundensis]RDW90741.1 Uncharacterized protein DSM5745_02516 [Aspergillus mulundensis]
MSTSPDGIYEPGIIDPGLPVPTPTQPFWLSSPSPLAKLRSPWLDQADIVIIGSGMTSVSLCRSLFAKCPDVSIIVLEARDLCSGATGRNGGHIKAMSPGVWVERKAQFGVQEALKIMEFEHGHLQSMTSCIKENGLERHCDLQLLEGLDVYHDRKVFERAVSAVKDMGRYNGKLAARYTVYESRQDLKARGLGDHVVGAIGMPAASMWPYKMVTGLFERMIQQGHRLSIQTNTTVTAVSENLDSATVHTTRGTISARHLIHATNCWLGHLLPELRPFVSPVRANVQRQVPVPVPIPAPAPAPQTQPQAQAQAPAHAGKNSFWLRYAEHDYDYLIQRPDGSYIIGRANTGRRATSDDGVMDVLPHAHLRGTTPLLFDFDFQGVSGTMETSHAWSGAVAFTLDGNPFVGGLAGAGRGRSHQWVCGAYQGIGMVRAWRTAQGLACLVVGEGLPGEFPGSMLLGEKRVLGFRDAVGRERKL